MERHERQASAREWGLSPRLVAAVEVQMAPHHTRDAKGKFSRRQKDLGKEPPAPPTVRSCGRAWRSCPRSAASGPLHPPDAVGERLCPRGEIDTRVSCETETEGPRGV